MVQYNQKIIEQFQLLIKQMKAAYLHSQLENDTKESTTNQFRIKATTQALSIIKKFNFEIRDISDIKGTPGLGKGSLDRIQEILETGELSELKKTKSTQQIDNIQELESVIGIGDKTAKKLIQEKKIRSIIELKKAIKSGKIEVSKQIKLGLKYHGIVQRDIPRDEVKKIEEYLKQRAKIIDPKLKIVICGSYRRGKKLVGDIDVLLHHPDFTERAQTKNPQKYDLEPFLEILISELTEDGFLLDNLTDKDYKVKYMGFCRYKNNPIRRIDIRLAAQENLPAMMLYYTGPYELNTAMRIAAKQLNMHLNEYGLFKVKRDGTKKLVEVNTEKHIFDLLHMKYLTPKQRDDFSHGKPNRI